MTNTFQVKTADPQSVDALDLIAALSSELARRYDFADDGSGHFTPADATVPGSVFVVGYADGKAVACGAFRPLDGSACEIKRMFVRLEFRGRGYSRAVLAELERLAADAGYSIARLETGDRQPDAIGLYEHAGYQRIANFGAYVGSERSVCFEKQLPQTRKEVDADEVIIRRATFLDAAAIADIYNEAILTTTATFDTVIKTVEERTQWLQSHDDRHPVLVAAVSSAVVGWASLSSWSDRCAYADTAETSFYVHSSHRSCGIGRRLKQAVIHEARRLGFHTLIARVAEGSEASLHLNAQEGFLLVGTLRQVGRKFGRLLDVHIMQKMLHDS
jgi:phosphinothricin acetyltransferase